VLWALLLVPDAPLCRRRPPRYPRRSALLISTWEDGGQQSKETPRPPSKISLTRLLPKSAGLGHIFPGHWAAGELCREASGLSEVCFVAARRTYQFRQLTKMCRSFFFDPPRAQAQKYEKKRSNALHFIFFALGPSGAHGRVLSFFSFFLSLSGALLSRLLRGGVCEVSLEKVVFRVNSLSLSSDPAPCKPGQDKWLLLFL